MCDPQSLTQKPMVIHTFTRFFNFYYLICQTCKALIESVNIILNKVYFLTFQPCNSVSSEKDTWPTENWYEPFLCHYTLDRVFSFSILTARVFAAGDPAQHTASSAQKCM
uniref:Uncharacterized protein n=1 Tax=Oryzias latipes TaxID=8090 RepID=A0A3P9KNX5_ORYLA